MEVLEEELGIQKEDRYKLKDYLGEGTFGSVRRAIDTITGREVAVKQIRLMSKGRYLPKAVFRELEALKQLSDGKYIVKFIDMYGSDSAVCIVMEHVELSLADIIEKTKHQLPLGHLKCYFYMMLQALNFCHTRSIIHRDIKPSNFLLSRDGVLKLGDFGLARIWDAQLDEDLSHQVSTRQYRAPELLFAARRYTSAIDVWGVAVIMVELVTLRPLFPSNNDLDQMFKVFQLMGSPTPDRWPGVESLPDFEKVNFASMDPVDLSLIMPTLRPEDIAFISRFLQLNPQQRCTAQQGLYELEYLSSLPLPCQHFELKLPLEATPKTSTKKPRPKPVSSMEELLALDVDAM